MVAVAIPKSNPLRSWRAAPVAEVRVRQLTKPLADSYPRLSRCGAKLFLESDEYRGFTNVQDVTHAPT